MQSVRRGPVGRGPAILLGPPLEGQNIPKARFDSGAGKGYP
jgi:hypothetical protein